MALHYIVLDGVQLRPSFPLECRRFNPTAIQRRAANGTLLVDVDGPDKREWLVTWDAGEAADLLAINTLFNAKTFKTFADEKGGVYTVWIDAEEGLSEALEFFEHNTSNAFYTFSVKLIEQ